MPSWGEILEEINREQENIQKLQAQGVPVTEGATDIVRRRYLSALAAHTGRSAIIYASGWLQKSQIPADKLVIHPSDIDGFLATVKGLPTAAGLDLILHSPGGMPEAAEQLVNYLRQKFENIRVIVPVMAMSAATMIACAANEIVMARHSALGPTDPQMSLRTNTGEIRSVAAHALRDDFKAACLDKPNFAAWAPIIGQYPPGILSQCDQALRLTEELVKYWLENNMFAGQRNAKSLARKISKHLLNANHHTHGRPLMRDHLRQLGMHVVDLERPDGQVFQDLVMSSYHAATHTLGGTRAVKIIENNLGNSYFVTV